MNNADDIRNLERLLAKHIQNLRDFQLRAVEYDSVNLPLHLQRNIEAEERTVARYRKELDIVIQDSSSGKDRITPESLPKSRRKGSTTMKQRHTAHWYGWLLASLLAISIALWMYFNYSSIRSITPVSIPSVTVPIQSGFFGRVLDEDGIPIPGAKVSFANLLPPPISYTESEGIFRLRLPQGHQFDSLRLHVEAEGYTPFPYERLIGPTQYDLEDIRLTKDSSSRRNFQSTSSPFSLIQFAWNPLPIAGATYGSIALYVCTKATRYWVQSSEIFPNPHGLIDKQGAIAAPCQQLPVPAYDVGPNDRIKVILGVPTGETGTSTQVEAFEARLNRDGTQVEVIRLPEELLSLPATPVPSPTPPPPTPGGCIDGPPNGSTQQGTTTIGGWADVGGSPVSRVEIWIDEVLGGVAEYGLNTHSDKLGRGWRWRWDTTTVTNGQHHFRVKAITIDGREEWLACGGDVGVFQIKVNN